MQSLLWQHPKTALGSRATDAQQCPEHCTRAAMNAAAGQVDPQIHSLILNTGINKRFRYGAFAKDLEDVAEAEAWENAKHQCRHVCVDVPV